jgi:hypothetical protein
MKLALRGQCMQASTDRGLVFGCVNPSQIDILTSYAKQTQLPSC